MRSRSFAVVVAIGCSTALSACGSSVPEGEALTELCGSLRRAQALSPSTDNTPTAPETIEAVVGRHRSATEALREAEDRALGALQGPLGRRAAWHERVVEQADSASSPQELQEQLGFADGVLTFTGASEAESDYDALRRSLTDNC